MTIRIFYNRLGTSSSTNAFQDYSNVSNWECATNILTLFRTKDIVYIPLVGISSFKVV